MKNSPNLIIALSEAQTAEEKGQYEKAFELLSEYWDKYSQFPNAVGLSEEESSELFLRFGGIIGFLGNSQKISNSQEISRNLLTQARQRFVSQANLDKASECENYLALAYSRTGEINEAFDWLNEALSRNLPENQPARINSYVIETLLDIQGEKYEKVLRRCAELKQTFEKNATDLHNGSFYNNLAIAYKNSGERDEALKYLKVARDFFLKANHKIYYGAAENNLAQLCHKVGQFEEAHLCAERARKIFEEIGDKMREGYSLETRAQIFAAQGKYDKALGYVNDAIELLEGGESYRNLVESYRTKIKILLGLSRLTEALTVMTAAHNIAALYISQELSREIIESVAALIQERSKAE